MHEDDDFLLSFKEQVKKDIKEILGLNPKPFEMHLSFGVRRKVYTWKDLPRVVWTYIVEHPEENIYVDYGGFMLLAGGDWTGFHRNIMEELMEYKEVEDANRRMRASGFLKAQKLEVANWVDTGAFLVRPMVSKRTLATLPVAAEREES